MEPFSDFKVYPPKQLASILGVSVFRVYHILDTRPHIKPAATIENKGYNKRFYRPDAVAMIRHELNAIDARRVA